MPDFNLTIIGSDPGNHVAAVCATRRGLKTAGKLLLLVLLGLTCLEPAAWSANSTSAPVKQRPSVGMTKAQVLSLYGAPFQHGTVKEGERWIYQLKFGEVYGRALVPFGYDSYDVYLGVITFDAKGTIRDIVWNHTVTRGSL